MEYKCDVLVVGCGIAGLCAALSAAEQGASVRILERSPKAERGGNSRYTSANVRLEDASAPTEDFLEQLTWTSEIFVEPSLLELTLKPYDQWPPILKAYGFADPELVATFIDNVPETMAWVKSFGVRFEPFFNPQTGMHITETVGGGIEAVEKLAPAAEKKNNINFHYEIAAQTLILNDKKEVIGIHAWSKVEGSIDFLAKSVILACGGFEGNQEMATRYLGHEAYRLRPCCRGGMYNKGEGIEMALQIGAAPAGQYDGFHGMIFDRRSKNLEPVLPLNHGILVNNRGRRFMDEGGGPHDMMREEIAQNLLMQPEGEVYFIFDNKLYEVPNYKRQLGSEIDPITAKSIEELAAKLAINPNVLKRTVESYNVAVQDGAFTPGKPDGKHTIGVIPAKSNWARKIEGPDFMAYPLVCTNCFNYGGLRVSPRSQVVNTEGYEIPGLYAAGEIIGLYYGYYAGATSFLRGMVFGRIAGRNASKV